jgi:hypothetical protein
MLSIAVSAFSAKAKGKGCQRPKDQSGKKPPIDPPSNTSIGNFLNSYSYGGCFH